MDGSNGCSIKWSRRYGAILIDHGANVHAPDKNGATSLIIAAENGCEDTVKTLLCRGADIHAIQSDQATALIVAAKRGDVNITRLLLNQGAIIHEVQRDEATAFIVAAQMGHTDVMRLLLDQGANVNDAQRDQATSLMLAVQKCHVDAVRLLLDRGANLEAVDENQVTALMFAAEIGHTGIARLLLDRGANVHAVQSDGYTALMVSAVNGHADVVQLLLDKCADVQVVAKHQVTALMLAAENGHYHVTRLLLDQGANIDAIDVNQQTALMLSASTGNAGVACLLIKRGANVDGVDNENCTAAMIAEKRGHRGIVHLLEAQARTTSDQSAPQFSKQETSREDAISLGFKASCDFRGSKTKSHENDMVLQSDASSSHQGVEKSEQPILIKATENDDIDTVRSLLENGEIVDVAGSNQWTALTVASRTGNLDLVCLLLNSNANVNVVDINGDSPLIFAAWFGHASVVETLTCHGANIDLQNCDGKTALDYAIEQGRKDIMRILLQGPSPVSMAHETVENENISAPQSAASISSNLISLDLIKSLCEKMHEAQEICLRVYTRLCYLRDQIEVAEPTQKETIVSAYEAILHRFNDFLIQYGNRCMITRIVSGRVMVSICQELNEQLSRILKLCGGNTNASLLDWTSQLESASEAHQALLTSVLGQKQLWLHELQDPDALAEALTLLLFELNHRAGTYGPDELQLIKQICQSVARYSKLGIPSIPGWFLPPHEVNIDAQALVGRGSYGSAYRGIWMGMSVVVKSVHLNNSESRSMFLKEADIWYTLVHPHIVKLFGACHVGNPFFVCEYAPNGTLADYLSHEQNRDKTWKSLHEAALGLCYLHIKRKAVHCDIKCDNILIGQDGVAKLTDFGMSCQESDLQSTENGSELGAIQWKAPECVSGETSGSFASDIYSFGMTIIEAVTRDFPWGMMDDAAVKNKVVEKHELPEQPAALSDPQWSLVKRMCAARPGDRLKITDVVKELKGFAVTEPLEKAWARKIRLR